MVFDGRRRKLSMCLKVGHTKSSMGNIFKLGGRTKGG